jgi:hypothetical protein
MAVPADATAKAKARREKLIVGGTIVLVVLTYLIYRHSQAANAAAAADPFGAYGSPDTSGSGGGLPPDYVATPTSTTAATPSVGPVTGGTTTPANVNTYTPLGPAQAAIAAQVQPSGVLRAAPAPVAHPSPISFGGGVPA